MAVKRFINGSSQTILKETRDTTVKFASQHFVGSSESYGVSPYVYRDTNALNTKEQFMRVRASSMNTATFLFGGAISELNPDDYISITYKLFSTENAFILPAGSSTDPSNDATWSVTHGQYSQLYLTPSESYNTVYALVSDLNLELCTDGFYYILLYVRASDELIIKNISVGIPGSIIEIPASQSPANGYNFFLHNDSVGSSYTLTNGEFVADDSIQYQVYTEAPTVITTGQYFSLEDNLIYVFDTYTNSWGLQSFQMDIVVNGMLPEISTVTQFTYVYNIYDSTIYYASYGSTEWSIGGYIEQRSSVSSMEVNTIPIGTKVFTTNYNVIYELYHYGWVTSTNFDSNGNTLPEVTPGPDNGEMLTIDMLDSSILLMAEDSKFHAVSAYGEVNIYYDENATVDGHGYSIYSPCNNIETLHSRIPATSYNSLSIYITGNINHLNVSTTFQNDGYLEVYGSHFYDNAEASSNAIGFTVTERINSKLCKVTINGNYQKMYGFLFDENKEPQNGAGAYIYDNSGEYFVAVDGWTGNIPDSGYVIRSKDNIATVNINTNADDFYLSGFGCDGLNLISSSPVSNGYIMGVGVSDVLNIINSVFDSVYGGYVGSLFHLANSTWYSQPYGMFNKVVLKNVNTNSSYNNDINKSLFTDSTIGNNITIYNSRLKIGDGAMFLGSEAGWSAVSSSPIIIKNFSEAEGNTNEIYYTNTYTGLYTQETYGIWNELGEMS